MTWVKGQSGNPNGWAKTNAEVEALARCWGIPVEGSDGDVSSGAALRRPEERWLRIEILETRERHRRACSPTDILRPEVSLLGGVHQMLTRRGVWQPGQSGNPKGLDEVDAPNGLGVPEWRC
jgi:hypothetical protein